MSDERTQVMTAAGIVRGYLYDGIYVFKGMPYARAQRFQKPEDTPPWEGVRDCTSYGYVSPLLNQERPVGELLVPHRYWYGCTEAATLQAPPSSRRPMKGRI